MRELWNSEKPVTIIHTMPPSSKYYGQGDVTCEFIGIARTGGKNRSVVTPYSFNGAGGILRQANTMMAPKNRGRL